MFFLIAFGSVLVLSLLRWLLAIEFEILDIDEMIWEFWIPAMLPWIPITIFLKPRLRVLTFKKDSNNRRFFFQIITWICVGVMLSISQKYLATATGKLTTLETIADIETVLKTLYYKLENFSVAPNLGSTYTVFEVSGKSSKRLNFDVYFVIPIFKDSTELAYDVPKYWYGIKYSKQISNRLSSDQKDEKYEEFYDQCVENINKYDFYTVDHFVRTPRSNDRNNYLNAIEASTFVRLDDKYIVLEPAVEDFKDRNGTNLIWIFKVFIVGLIVLLFSLLFPRYNERQRNKRFSRKKLKQDDIVKALRYLIPQGDHFATSIIIDINILIFILTLLSGNDIISPEPWELLYWGGNRRFEVMDGQWWRLFTALFLHSGIIHLISNIVGLVIAAKFIEPLLGRHNYFILFILSGLCGSLASVLWYENTVSVGASGAIMGLYGAILGLLYQGAYPDARKKYIFVLISIFVGLSLLGGLADDVDNAAHIGGLLSGLVIGSLLYKYNSQLVEE